MSPNDFAGSCYCHSTWGGGIKTLIHFFWKNKNIKFTVRYNLIQVFKQILCLFYN